jgi:hypothetical protein
VDTLNGAAYSALHAAAQGGHHEVMQLLLRKGANPRLRTHRGKTALVIAARKGHVGLVQLLLEAWGQPEVTAAELAKAAKAAASTHGVHHMAAFARLAKELHRLDPAELQQLFQGQQRVPLDEALAAVLDGWASDVSSIDEQLAALRRREEDLAVEKAGVQQLIVRMAGMAVHAQQGHADMETYDMEACSADWPWRMTNLRVGMTNTL